MKRYWNIVRTRIDDMSLRERAMIFAAAAFVLYSLIHAVLLDPLLAKQKALSAQVIQQQEKMKELQAMMESWSKARHEDDNSPLRARVAQLKKQLEEQDGYLQSRRDRLVAPDKMAQMLEKVLSKERGLQLVSLETLPLSLLVDDPKAMAAAKTDGPLADSKNEQNQIYKHGVRISVRGGYKDLLRYVTALEKMPVQMFWGDVLLNVDQYPNSVLTLTLYTLSLDEKWLTV